MFERSLKLGQILGIRLQAHWTLLIIFLLIAAHLGFGVLPAWHPEWGFALIGIVAISASIIFFASILVHELAHAIAARGFGLEVSDITLFLFGGVSSIESEPDSPWSEVVIAVVGPIASLVLGFSMIAAAGAIVPNLEQIESDPEQFLAALGPLTTILLWAGPLNLLLGIFNMIPAFPMDGGRVLRAALWGLMGDVRRATVWAATVSRSLSWAFVAVGFAMMLGISIPLLGSGLFGGLWIAIIGWFIGRAAKASVVMQQLARALEGVSVRQVAVQNGAVVDAATPLSAIAERYVSGSSDERVLVRDGERLAGVFEVERMRAVPREQWPNVSVGELTEPLAEGAALDADTGAFEAFKELQRRGLEELPVVESNGRLLGMVRLEEIGRWLRLYGPESTGGLRWAAT